MTLARCANCLHGADDHLITGACSYEGEGGGCPCEDFEPEEEESGESAGQSALTLLVALLGAGGWGLVLWMAGAR